MRTFKEILQSSTILGNYDPLDLQQERLTNADFSILLRQYNMDYTLCGYYWQVGPLQQTQGWILDLSVVITQLPTLLRTLLPVLRKAAIPFKIVCNESIANSMLEGALGPKYIARIISIYPPDDKFALYWAKELITITNGFKGPRIPTDRHLGSIVHTRYGAFQPVMTMGQDGVAMECIYNAKGELIPESFGVPFSVPFAGINWPFSDITPVQSSIPSKLLNRAYYPLTILKPDVRGDVLRGIYFDKIWKIRACLIKQGKANMAADVEGRDIQDRLQWQFELHRKLHTIIPIPKIYDCFFQHEDRYLVMEFIKGDTLTNWVWALLQHRSWPDVHIRLKITLLRKFIQILDIIGRLHNEGYIHRDITSENFLINRKGKLTLIDLELAWCAASQKPNPAFRTGTEGFMSPQQRNNQKPTIQDDIYALGGLFIFFVTGIFPMKFEKNDLVRLNDQLLFFVGEKSIPDLITSCRDVDPLQRPTLEQVRQIVTLSLRSLEQNNDPFKASTNAPTSIDVSAVIQAALNGMGSPIFISPDKHWFSLMQMRDLVIRNEQVGVTSYPGWHTGVAGPLWLLGLAQKTGFSIENCKDSYQASWSYIEDRYLNKRQNLSAGLYSGAAGLAFALCEGLDSGLLQSNESTRQLLVSFLSMSCSQLDLTAGVAGQGLALLKCSHWLKEDVFTNLLGNCIELILKGQYADGSWPFGSPNGKAKRLAGINEGIAGITWFLLSCLQSSSDVKVEKAARKGLNWLVRKGLPHPGISGHPAILGKGINAWNIGQGVLGILLPFIKGYEQLGDISYREIAEQHLRSIMPRPLQLDLTLESGLAGLGELYMEAFQTFKEPIWKERADWISQVLLHILQSDHCGYGYYITGLSSIPTADLFTGNSGIIHFLLRYKNPDTIGHPLSIKNCMRINTRTAAAVPRAGIAENL